MHLKRTIIRVRSSIFSCVPASSSFIFFPVIFCVGCSFWDDLSDWIAVTNLKEYIIISMENLSWDGSTSSLWTESIQQHDQIEPASFINNSNSCSLFYGGHKVIDLASASAAAAAADQTIFNNNPMIQNRFEKAHHQATHFINSRWEGNNDLCYISDRSLIGLEEANLGMTNGKVQHFVSTTNGGGGVSTTTTTTGGSIDSLDCLMSAETTINNNSNTDTSDDDGISMILSAADCRNIWASFGGGGGAAVSSAESSENINGGCNNLNNPKTQKDEKNSSYHHQDDTKRPNSTTKRSSSLNKDRYNFDLLHQSSDYSCTTEGGFKLILEESNQPKPKKRPRSENRMNSLNINFQQHQHQQPSNSSFSDDHQEPDTEAIAQMKEIIYRAAVFRPVDLEMEVKMEKPKRKNVRISSDPQTVAARQRRERISERIRVLQRLVPGGSKMDTASMLDEAANYLKFLRSQVKALENVGHHKLDSSINSHPFSSMPFNNHSFPMQTHWPFSTPKP